MLSITNFIFWSKNYIFRLPAIQQYKIALHNGTLEPKRLQQLNWEKRKCIVNYAYNNIPFYKTFYDSMGFNPSMLQTETDWNKIPILSKEEVRKNLESIKDPSAPANIVGITTTGGSTGTPLKVYTDKRFNWEVLGWRMFKYWGISPASHIGIIHRRVPTSFISKLKNRMIWWPTKRAYLNASSITEQNIEKFINEINRKKIQWIQGYVGGLERIADYILDHQIKITTIKLVWSTSAPLLNNVRRKLEFAFNCKIMNQYGCCEIPNIAMQCPKGKHLHINYDSVHIDITNTNGDIIKDEEGDILVTNLESRVFPLIKYKLGDRGTILSDICTCGKALPLLKQIKGRISDAVYTPSGIYIDGNYLTTLFDNYSCLFNQFQIYQYSNFSITIRVKIYKDDKITTQALENIKEKLRKDTHNEIPIDILIVNHIDDDKGKIRYIISEIALAQIIK